MKEVETMTVIKRHRQTCIKVWDGDTLIAILPNNRKGWDRVYGVYYGKYTVNVAWR